MLDSWGSAMLPWNPDREGFGMSLKYGFYKIGRRLSRVQVIRSLVPQGLRRAVQSRLGADLIDQFPDRRYMEAAILPAIAAIGPRRLLDVGVEYYTAHYGRWFDQSVERWTLDLNPDVVKYGVPGRHIQANVLDLGRHFEPSSLDVVMMNGPFGYGIDRVDEQVRTLEVAHGVMRPGGWLLIGWDRAPDGGPLIAAAGARRRDASDVKDPLELEIIQRRFEHVGPQGLPARKEFTDSSHIYDWFQARP